MNELRSAAVSPQPVPEPPAIAAPCDVEHPGVVQLSVDASDVVRGVIVCRQTLPVGASGPLVLLYPKWMPGYHSPENPIELLAGLEIRAGDRRLDWRRDPVEVHAFHLHVPEGVTDLDLRFQFLSPTTSAQGEVIVTSDMLLMHWGRTVLYPAGYFVRRIQVRPELRLPSGWSYATALATVSAEDGRVVFESVPLDVLVDTPVMAGERRREVALDDAGDVQLHLFGHADEHLAATPEQLAPHRELVRQADRLFASRHFDRYRFLTALSNELGGGGVEHHRSTEIIAEPGHFSDWERTFPKRDVFAHEYVHSWNGKFRRGEDSWTPSFELPIRNSLMWLYEGQTQYWGHVLTARSGLWSAASAKEALAKVAATYDVRPGELWRTMADTTRDPVIASRMPLPWPSWQRSEDYYSEGQLMWLAVDTLIRERSGERRSLDDFARAFFGLDDGSMVTRTYDFDEVVRTLESVADHDWRGFLEAQLESRQPGAPLEGLERGGYRLIYRDYRTDFCRRYDALLGQFDMRFSIGLTLTTGGVVQEVMWDSAAFLAGTVAGAQIEQVNGQDYSEVVIGDAVERAANGGAIELDLRVRGRPRKVSVEYTGGHRFPHLEIIPGTRPRLDEILAPL